jgi:hypothetical protein
MRLRGRWTIPAAAIAAGALAAPPTLAGASPPRVRELQAISGRTPFRGGCGVPGQPTPSSEAEPYIAVDPADPRHLVATWQQDRFAVDGGDLANLVAVSSDGGRTWRRGRVRGVSRCTGGEDERASDPWLAIGARGRTTLMGNLTFDEIPALSGLAAPTQQRASRSTNLGASFAPPVTIAADGAYNDRESVTVDPTRPGHAYFVWVKRYGTFGESGLDMFSRTVDAGKTWSPERVIQAPPTGTLPDPTLVEVLPNGELLNLYLQANLTPFLPAGSPIVPWQVMAARSRDAGSHWSAPIGIGSIGHPFAPEDPTTGTQVRAYPVISAAVAPSGEAYVVWNEIKSKRSSRIFLSRSGDGGIDWSPPKPIATVPTQAFLPSIAVARDGTIGVTWDAFTGDRRGDHKLTTRVWFARSLDGGRRWRRIPIGGPFDMLSTSPTSSTGITGRFVGDYQGLAGRRHDFVAVFAEGRAIHRRRTGAPRVHGPSDIIFARLVPGRRRR